MAETDLATTNVTATTRPTAEAFLARIGEAAVTPAEMTDRCRTALARPKVDVEQEARDYLGRFKGATFIVLEDRTFGDAIALRGRVETASGKAAFSARFIKADDGLRLDWLHRSDRLAMKLPSPSDPELAAAQDTVQNFLDLIMGGDLRLAHALMAPTWRTKLAPPTAKDTADGYDHSPTALVPATKAWKGEYVAYTLPKAEMTAQNRATFTASMEAGGSTKPYTIVAVRDPAAGWRIDAFNP